MLRTIWLPLLLSLSAQAAPSAISCTDSNLPDSRLTKFVALKSSTGNWALLSLKRNARLESKETILAKGMECVQAKSDFRVLNCRRPTEPGSPYLADATLTIIKHSYLSAGPISRSPGHEDAVDALTENYRLFFRDDKKKENGEDVSFRPPQCREANAQEIQWAEGLLQNL